MCRPAKNLLLCVVAILVAAPVYAADVNVLVLGSNRVYGSYNDAKSFHVQSVANELRNILNADPALTNVQVDYESLDTPGCSTGNLLTYRYHAPGNWYYDASQLKGSGDPSDRDNRRLPLLRGQTTPYNYVVLLDDPAIMESMPGQFMQGVKAIVEEVNKSNATPILLMSWPGEGSTSTVSHYKEVTYRIGRGLGVEVAPAALAWQSEGSIYGTSHPTTDGAYLAAASIYSQIFDQSASSSTYKATHHPLANRVNTVVDANRNTSYSGRYNKSNNPQKILYFRDRQWKIRTQTSKSTEGGIKSALEGVMKADWNRWHYGGQRGTHHHRSYSLIDNTTK